MIFRGVCTTKEEMITLIPYAWIDDEEKCLIVVVRSISGEHYDIDTIDQRSIDSRSILFHGTAGFILRILHKPYFSLHDTYVEG
jgi:hypothetical protein